jgi:hypothetical protein
MGNSHIHIGGDNNGVIIVPGAEIGAAPLPAAVPPPVAERRSPTPSSRRRKWCVFRR